MKDVNIYTGHSTSIDFEEHLYRPLRNIRLVDEHNILLPHGDSDEPFNLKEFLKSDCDVLIAEVSEPSIGLGIELGWADLYEVPVMCIYREGSNPSSSLTAISNRIEKYESDEDLVDLIRQLIKDSWNVDLCDSPRLK